MASNEDYWDDFLAKQNYEALIEERKASIASYISNVYLYMSAALALTGLVAFFVASSPYLLSLLIGNRLLFFGLIIGELFLVGYLSIRIQKMSASTAWLVFFGYAALNGITLSVLFLAYSLGSVVGVFGVTAATFAVMSAVGYYTKQDLTKFGQILMMALIGVVIASIVNLFMNNSSLYWIISYVGVAVFVGLIAYDTQKIKAYALLDSEEDRKRGAVLGALALYLDFINLFIFLLRIFGSRR